MVIANFINKQDALVTGLDQYDYGQVLRIQGLNLPTAVEIHFGLEETGGTTTTRIGVTKDGVTDVPIPDSMLENGDTSLDYTIYAFVYLTDETSGKTVHRIKMQVKARSKPELLNKPEDKELFQKAIEAVNQSAKEAEGWAHGREDMPERAADNAKYYAGESAKSAESVKGVEQNVKDMVATIGGIEQQVQDVKEYAGQAKNAAENALLSEQEAKKSEEASLQHRTGAETAENNAELAESNAKKSEQAVEQAKQLVMQMGQEVLNNKSHVDGKVEEFNKTVKDASDAIETAKTDAMDAVETAGTEQTKKVADEGAKQVKAVEDKGQEVLQSIPEDFTTQMQNKLDKQQGSENKGKALVVGEDGNVTVGEVQGGDGIPIINTMSGESPLVVPDSAERVNKGLSIIGNTVQNQDPPPSPDNPQEIKNVGKWNPETQKYEVDIKVTNAKESWDKEQTITLTSDRPITKWDKLVEQDGQIGWLYGSKIYVVTGNEVFESRDGYNIESYTNRFFILNDLLMENDALKPLAYMKCLRHKLYIYAPNIFEEGFETNKSQFHIKFLNERVGISTSDDNAVRTLKYSEYVKKMYKDGNPIEILYATRDTAFIPLSQSEQDAIRALKTYYPTTVITVDGGEVIPSVELTYTADTKNFILNREKAMQAQMLNIQSALISQKISGGGIKVTDSSGLPVEEFSMSGKMEQLQSTGKNLISVPDIEAGSSQQSIPCLLEKDVYISCHEKTAKVSGDIWRIRIMFKDKSSKYLTDSQMEGGNKFVCGTENPIIGIVVRGNNIESGAYRKIQVEYGSAKTSYEPFTCGKPTPSPDYPQPIETTPQGIITVDFTDGTNHQTVELNCPREFTKWDRLQKIDGVWNWVFQSKKIDLSAPEDSGYDRTWHYNNNNNGVYFAYIVQDKKGGNQSSVCETFKNVNVAYGGTHKSEFGIYCDHPTIGVKHLFFRPPNESIITLDNWKDWLKVNKLVVIYETEDTIETIPLSQIEQDKLNALTMYATNTEITNTGGCNMELTYTVDTKSYVDAKIAEVSTAVVQKGIENV